MKNPFQVLKIPGFSDICDFFRGLVQTRNYDQYYRMGNYGHLCFRGQDDSEYKLIPSLFRDMNGKKDIPNREVLNLFMKEFLQTKDFIFDADQLGATLPPGYTKLKNADLLTDQHIYDWSSKASNDSLELIALAQHHGIKTRLLDFTFDFYIALFFASQGAFKKMGALSEEQIRSKCFSVWILDWCFFNDRVNNKEHYKIQGYFAGFSNSPYLRAQKGLFITPIFENGLDTNTISCEDFDIKNSVEACSWELARISGEKDNWPVLFRIDIPYSEAPWILLELERLKYTTHTVMPSLDNIVRHWEFSKEVRKMHDKIQTEVSKMDFTGLP